MKSQVMQLLDVYAGFREDIRCAYPALRGVDLDFQRLARIAENRGLGLFVLDLPNLDSILTDGLENGRLVCSGPLSREVSAKVRVPRLFSGLWLRIFSKDACLKQDADVNAIAFLRQLCCFGKKIASSCSPQRNLSAIKEFYDVDRAIRQPTLQWESDELFPDDSDHPVHLCDGVATDLPLYPCSQGTSGDSIKGILTWIQHVADSIVGEFDDYNPTLFSEQRATEVGSPGFKHGPGAVARKVVDKFDFEYWPKKLSGWFPPEEFAFANTNFEKPLLNHELPSRLIIVKKTAKSPRLIAAEPVEHQWCQQLTLRYLEDMVKKSVLRHFIDFSNQGKSGEMALRASLDSALATIDLKSASDRLSCWLVERIFRRSPSLLSALHAHRTRYIQIERSGRKDFLKLRKFATQGTAVTFPVQSIVFTIIALAISSYGDHRVRSDLCRLRTRVRVYGDDIIIPSTGYAGMISALKFLGLEPNVAKSFVKGRFRESCGTDAYGGYDVTPVKPSVIIPDGPESIQAVMDTLNNLFSKGYWNASERLRRNLPAHVQKRTRIVGVDSGLRGFTSFCGGYEHHLEKRWSKSLHRTEVRVWGFATPARKRSPYMGPSRLLEFFTRSHSLLNPRVAYADSGRARKAKARLLWEPQSEASY